MEKRSIDRRSFVAAMGAIGALSIAGTGLPAQADRAFAQDATFPDPKIGQPVEAKVDISTGEVTVNEDILVRFSACLGCYSSCGNRVKIERDTGAS